MSRTRSLILTLAMLTAAPVGAQSTVGPGVADVLDQHGSVRVLVALDDGIAEARRGAVTLNRLRASVRAVQDRVLDVIASGDTEAALRFEAVPAVVVTVRTEAALEALAAHPDVLRIDLDAGGGSGGGLGQSVPLVQATEWHDRGVRGAGVVVAVMDSGIDTDHADFAGAVIDEACFLNTGDSSLCPNGTTRQTGAGSAEDDHGHGTNVTGVIASQGDVASVGVAPDVDVVVLKTLDRRNAFASFSEVIAALDYLVMNPDLGVQVVNMSLGSAALFPAVCDNAASWTIAGANAANTLRQRGVSLFASAMNEGSPTSVAAPACLSAVMAVGATTLSDAIAPFSNTGPQVEIVAPGAGITASGRGGGLSTFSGTSQASPHVAGCAALLIAGGAASTPDEVMDALLTASTVDVTDPDNGRTFPRLDCFDASFQVASEDGPASGPTLSAPYPNPARTVARVDLRTAGPEAVRADLLDGLGRTVAVIHDGPVSGDIHTLSVDVGGLPAGVYTLRVTGASTEAARQILVVR